MKKMEKRLRKDSAKAERYTCAECLPENCTCYYIDRETGISGNISKNEQLSYRRS